MKLTSWYTMVQLGKVTDKFMLQQMQKVPTVLATATPTTQQDGVSSLVDNDLWISTADLENYPKIYKFDTTLPGTDGVGGGWVSVDNTDQTSENGILFADARYNTSGANSGEAGTIEALLSMTS